MKKEYLIGIILIILFSLWIYISIFDLKKEDKPHLGLKIREIGQNYRLYVYAYYEETYLCIDDFTKEETTCGNYTYFNGVNVTIEDISTGEIQSNITSRVDEIDKQDGFVEFLIVIGNEYLVTAEFNNSKKSANCLFSPRYISLDIIMTNDNKIENIEC